MQLLVMEPGEERRCIPAEWGLYSYRVRCPEVAGLRLFKEHLSRQSIIGLNL